LILASASPRRAELLTAAGYVFTVDAVDVDERQHPGESPEAYVGRVARLKAEAARARHPDQLVLAADTAVVVDGDVLGKPAGEADAARMLRRLSGRSHVVVTGVAVACGSRLETGVERTVVWFAPLPDAIIQWYVESGEPLDKAGGYAIQGLASRFVPRIDGSYSNVVGLPVALAARLLASCTNFPAAVF
jgi:septum formation protein